MAAGKKKQVDMRHNDGAGWHVDSKGRHGDGKRQQGEMQHDDGDGQHDDGNGRHDDGKGQQGVRRHDNGGDGGGRESNGGILQGQ